MLIDINPTTLSIICLYTQSLFFIFISFFHFIIAKVTIEMASSAKFSYHRLRNEGGHDHHLDDYHFHEVGNNFQINSLGRPRRWYRFRSRVPGRRRFKLKIPSLRRVLRRRAKLVSSVKVSLKRVVKRLKESQSHLGDLFAGNYLFLQVSPTSLKCLDKGHHDLNGLSSRYSLPKTAN